MLTIHVHSIIHSLQHNISLLDCYLQRCKAQHTRAGLVGGEDEATVARVTLAGSIVRTRGTICSASYKTNTQSKALYCLQITYNTRKFPFYRQLVNINVPPQRPMVPVVVTANPALQLKALHVVCEVATTYVQAVHLSGQAVRKCQRLTDNCS